MRQGSQQATGLVALLIYQCVSLVKLICGGSWVVLAIVLEWEVLSVPLAFYAPLVNCSIVMVLLLISSLLYSIFVFAAARRLLLHARRDGGQTKRCP